MTHGLLDGLVVVCQGFVGVGFHAFACYRCYLQSVAGTRNLAEEFKKYGLPGWTVWLVVLAEFSLGWVFTFGIVVDVVVVPTSFVISAMMMIAVMMRCKAQEEMHKAVPATVFGLLSVFVLITQSTRFGPAVLRLLSGQVFRPVADDVNHSALGLGLLCTQHGRANVVIFVLIGDVLLCLVTLYEYVLATKQDADYDALDDHQRRSTPLSTRRSSHVLEAVV